MFAVQVFRKRSRQGHARMTKLEMRKRRRRNVRTYICIWPRSFNIFTTSFEPRSTSFLFMGRHRTITRTHCTKLKLKGSIMNVRLLSYAYSYNYSNDRFVRIVVDADALSAGRWIDGGMWLASLSYAYDYLERGISLRLLYIDALKNTGRWKELHLRKGANMHDTTMAGSFER